MLAFLSSLWRRLVWRVRSPAALPGPSRAPDPPKASVAPEPSRVELIPGALALGVTAHTFECAAGAVRCWVLSTDGLRAVGQTELVVMVRMHPRLTLPVVVDSLAPLLRGVHALALQGQVVARGGRTLLRADGPGFLGRPDLRGILYAAPQPVPGLALPDQHLLAIFVTDAEVRIAERTGHARVLARLGRQAGYYPTPPWNDVDREAVAHPGDSGSILARVPVLHLHGGYVRRVSDGSASDRADGSVVLELTQAAGERLGAALAELPPGTPLGVLSDFDAAWDAQLVWTPGQERPEAIGPAALARRIGANFLVLAPNAEEDTTRLLEDGFVLMLRQDRWQALGQAVAVGEPFVLEEGGRPIFALRRVEEAYASPVDGGTWRAEGGFRKYEPDGGARAPAPRESRLSRVVLLTAEPEIADAIDTSELTAFIRAQTRAILDRTATAPGPAGADLVAECLLRAAEPPVVKLAFRPRLDAELVTGILDGLSAVPAPALRRGEVRYHLMLALWGGSGQDAPAS